MSLVNMVTLKSAGFSWSAAQTSPRGTGAAHARAHPFFAHALHCSDGNTPLTYATQYKKADVAAYLRSIGAPQ
jgi:hypothetical protein